MIYEKDPMSAHLWFALYWLNGYESINYAREKACKGGCMPNVLKVMWGPGRGFE